MNFFFSVLRNVCAVIGAYIIWKLKRKDIAIIRLK